MVKVNLVYFRMGHLSRHSGCEMIGKYMAVNRIDDRIPDWINKLMPKRIVRFAINRSGVGWYTDRSFFLEAKTALHLASRKREIYHFLYGENSYCYTGFIPYHPTSKIVCSFHQPPDYFAKLVRRRNHLAKLNATIVVSRKQLEYFTNIIGKDRVHFIPHGVDNSFFKPSTGEAGRDRQTCLFVGQWLRDFEMLKEVIRLVHAKNRHIKFQIVTDAKNHAIFQGIPNVFLYCGLSDEELLGLYQKATILVMPMLDCTANNAILEGMACGLPIVTTDVGGVLDYVDERCAVLVEPKNSEAMTQWVLELCGNAALRTKMGEEARKKALTYSWPVVINQLKKVYTDLFQA